VVKHLRRQLILGLSSRKLDPLWKITIGIPLVVEYSRQIQLNWLNSM